MPAQALAASGDATNSEAAADCAREPDDALRLACYDHHFRRSGEAQTQAHPTAPPAPTGSVPRAIAPRTGVAPPTGSVASVLSKTWELQPADKRGTFVVRTYLPNYFLPFHASSSIGNPSSPTHPASTEPHQYRRVETKLQISLRTKVAEDLLLPGADLWFTYTQRSLWQLWTPSESSPFRSTDYQPEAIFVVPAPASWSPLPFGWHWRMAQLGIVHQSNGQSDPLSRSWNRVYVGAALERGELGLQLKAYRRLPESGEAQTQAHPTAPPAPTGSVPRAIAPRTGVAPPPPVAQDRHRVAHLAHRPRVTSARLAAVGLDLSGEERSAARAALVRAALQWLRRDLAGLQPPADQHRGGSQPVPVLIRAAGYRMSLHRVAARAGAA